MFARYATTALVGSMLFAGAAFAQNPTATSDRAGMAPAAASESSFQGDWRVSKIPGVNVYNDKNENVGSINDLLMDKSGTIKAAVISVGGVLGVGARLVAVPFDKIKFVSEPVAYTGASNAPAGNRPASDTTTGSAANPPPTSTSTTSKSNPWYPDHAVLNTTKDELQKMPEFKYSE
jgi:sporulation protein YlmC with PRC-barrel domain